MKKIDENTFQELDGKIKSPTASVLDELREMERQRKRDSMVPLILTIIGTVAAVVAAAFSAIQLFQG